MAKQTINNIKLGLFVIAGFAFFMLMLYWVGKDTNMFSSNIILKARFQNVNGLMPGNNVRSSGIQGVLGNVRQFVALLRGGFGFQDLTVLKGVAAGHLPRFGDVPSDA